MNPDEDEPKNEGEPAPDPQADNAAPETQPEIAEASAAAPEFIEDPSAQIEEEPELAEVHEATHEPIVELEPELPEAQAYEPPPEPIYVEPEPEPEPVKNYDPRPPRAPEPPAYEPPPRIHEAAAEDLHEEPLAEIESSYMKDYEPELEPEKPSAFDHEEYPFGEPDIPMPEPLPRPGDRQRRRDAKRNLDLDLGRIKRRKRFGLFITTVSVLFIAFVLAPVTWVGAYLFFDPPSNVLMMQRAAEGETIRHYPVALNRMSPHVVRAVIAAEDANFCAHDGFDIEAIQDAMEANARGGRTRGASTISQQVAKNLFLWPERSWVRKGFETYFTALIEFMWPKRRIMEAYLNTAEWGDGNFGIEAAARARFNVSAQDLSPLQAARLAAVLPSPNRWRADNPGPYVRGRSASIVARAREVRNSRSASCVLIMDRPSGA
jgi:monofunctional biosynthetic peptidoglycan transglycosylase